MRSKGRGCVDQINIKLLYLGKGRKLYAASMNLEKSYERVDRRTRRTTVLGTGLVDSNCSMFENRG